MAPTKEENEAGYFRPKVDEAAMCLFDRFLALTNLEMEAIVGLPNNNQENCLGAIEVRLQLK